MPDEPMATVRHLREARVCAAGARGFFRDMGLSWNDFISIGVPASALEATGDPFALKVAACAREEAAHGRKQ
jgi:hypothetical protein